MMRRIAVLGLLAAVLLPMSLSAQSAEEIQAQIDANDSQIKQLQAEIAQYETQLNATTAQKNTLQKAINQLTLQNKQLATKIKLTTGQISTTQLQIKQLAGTISQTQQSINTENAGLAESLRRLSLTEGQPLALMLLSAGGITAAWDDIRALTSLQSAVNSHVVALSQKQKILSDTKSSAEQKNSQLIVQQKTLKTQQGSLAVATAAKNDLLTQTKSKESEYQALIAAKRAQEADLEAALSDLKAKYNVAVDPTAITPVGKGILQWPLDKVRITQYFGNTAFASSGAYGGKGHNGMDFAASIGTPIHAALTGTVVGTGNTDLVRGCYSFGKWVMVKHANGLSTMYAHLSSISVSQGESVSTGDLLGFSGETGYATGPHLHFGVYVSASTQIITLGQATNQKTPCANAVMPVTPLAGYLNPVSYLPAL